MDTCHLETDTEKLSEVTRRYLQAKHKEGYFYYVWNVDIHSKSITSSLSLFTQGRMQDVVEGGPNYGRPNFANVAQQSRVSEGSL